ncbi:MAG TPA: SCP2 sterol-binding domain-containing protein [Anaerolineae bacterium]|nr:SCP2 sterol-binding domain-containing protein [Anaerolineae bacterium]
MPIFTDEAQLYEALDDLFTQLREQYPPSVNKLLRSRLLIVFQCSGPTASVVIDARQRPLDIRFGTNATRPTLDIQLSTDTLHAIMLGQTSLKKALGQRQVVVKGPILKTMALSDLFSQIQQVYPQIAREHGL